MAGFAIFIGLLEAAIAVAIVIGFFTEIAAALLVIIVLTVHYFRLFKWKSPFAAYENTSWELDLLLLAIALLLLFLGAGELSVDATIGIWP